MEIWLHEYQKLHEFAHFSDIKKHKYWAMMNFNIFKTFVKNNWLVLIFIIKADQYMYLSYLLSIKSCTWGRRHEQRSKLHKPLQFKTKSCTRNETSWTKQKNSQLVIHDKHVQYHDLENWNDCVYKQHYTFHGNNLLIK